jgi:hypothetical protein
MVAGQRPRRRRTGRPGGLALPAGGVQQPDDATEVYPDAVWPGQVADALAGEAETFDVDLVGPTPAAVRACVASSNHPTGSPSWIPQSISSWRLTGATTVRPDKCSTSAPAVAAKYGSLGCGEHQATALSGRRLAAWS